MPVFPFPHNFRNVLSTLGLFCRMAILCVVLGLLAKHSAWGQNDQQAGQAAEAMELPPAEDGAHAEVPLEQATGEVTPTGNIDAGVAESAEQTGETLTEGGEGPTPAVSAEDVAVERVEAQALSAPGEDTVAVPSEPPAGVAPGDVPAELETLPTPLEAELSSEDLDLIPLPEGMDGDRDLLDLPRVDGSDLLLPADIPPLEVAPALPPVPVGEPAKIISARYKQLRTKVEKDPALVSLWEQSQAASTYEQQRAGLREYYRLLFQKMRAEDPTLTMRIDAMEAAYLRRLSQTIIEPTIPLEPPPTPEPLAPLP